MSVNHNDSTGGRGTERAAPRETSSPVNHGVSRSASDAYHPAASSHHEAMMDSRNNPAADQALPNMRLAANDTREKQAGVKIKEGKDSTGVSYKDGSSYKTEGDKTKYDNGRTTAESVHDKDFNYNSIEHKNSELKTEELDTQDFHATTDSYQGREQGTELTDKKTGATSYKEKVPPSGWKEPGYDPAQLKDFDRQFGNRITI